MLASYDAIGCASVTDPSGSTSYTYDTSGRVAGKTSVIGGISKTITQQATGSQQATAASNSSKQQGQALTIA